MRSHALETLLEINTVSCKCAVWGDQQATCVFPSSEPATLFSLSLKKYFYCDSFEFASLAWSPARSRTANCLRHNLLELFSGALRFGIGFLALWPRYYSQVSCEGSGELTLCVRHPSPPLVPTYLQIMSTNWILDNKQLPSDWVTLLIAFYEFSPQPPQPLSASSRCNADTVKAVNCCVCVRRWRLTVCVCVCVREMCVPCVQHLWLLAVGDDSALCHGLFPLSSSIKVRSTPKWLHTKREGSSSFAIRREPITSNNTELIWQETHPVTSTGVSARILCPWNRFSCWCVLAGRLNVWQPTWYSTHKDNVYT